MAAFISEVLADKGITLPPEHREKLPAKWSEIQRLKGDLSGIRLEDADIALRNIPGGDHLER